MIAAVFLIISFVWLALGLFADGSFEMKLLMFVLSAVFQILMRLELIEKNMKELGK